MKRRRHINSVGKQLIAIQENTERLLRIEQEKERRRTRKIREALKPFLSGELKSSGQETQS